MESDRERAEALIAEMWRVTNPNLASRVVDAMLEFAAREAERTLGNCTCDPHEVCEEHARRAAELRKQKESV